MKLFDVLAVSIASGKVRVQWQDMNQREAETEAGALQWYMSDTGNFFVAAPADSYRDGDFYEGRDKR